MPEQQEERKIFYDADLDIEAYSLCGIVQRFPKHFHDYYVIGLVEKGSRHLWCRDREYDLAAGDIVLFNPREAHFCAPLNGERLDYRAVNIKPEVMEAAVSEINGSDCLPQFREPVVRQGELAVRLKELYGEILSDAPRLEREESFYFLLEAVLQGYAVFSELYPRMPGMEIRKLCAFIEEHFSENISLDELSERSGFSKSYLLRVFTKETGVSPYRYLQNVRLERTKQYLEQGIPPVDAAGMAGFSDQSHFTNFFKEFIGVTPKQYQKIFTEDCKADGGKRHERK